MRIQTKAAQGKVNNLYFINALRNMLGLDPMPHGPKRWRERYRTCAGQNPASQEQRQSQ